MPPDVRPRFIGFDADQRKRVEDCFEAVKYASRKATEALLSGDLTAYRKWFESSGTKHFTKVVRIVSKIDQDINHRRILFKQGLPERQKPGQRRVAGYVELKRTAFGKLMGDALRISRPAPGWDKTYTTPGIGIHINLYPEYYAGRENTLVQTIYHEISHAVGSTYDVSTDPQVCAQNAISNTDYTVSNAENYALFMMEYLGEASLAPQLTDDDI